MRPRTEWFLMLKRRDTRMIFEEVIEEASDYELCAIYCDYKEYVMDLEHNLTEDIIDEYNRKMELVLDNIAKRRIDKESKQ